MFSMECYLYEERQALQAPKAFQALCIGTAECTLGLRSVGKGLWNKQSLSQLEAGTQYSMGELLRMVEDEDDIDPQQLWMLSMHMFLGSECRVLDSTRLLERLGRVSVVEIGTWRGLGPWTLRSSLLKVENLTWRLRNIWSKNGQEICFLNTS